jgi:hypothetical protein
MTNRKPPGMDHQTWVDQQIREAHASGAFDDLPGAGKPIEGLDRQDENAWVRDFIQREGIPSDVLLPEPLKLRKEVEQFAETARKLRTEAEVREAAEDLNQRIRDCIRFGTGPVLPGRPVDVDAAVEQWKAERAVRTTPAPPAANETARPSWWSRLLRRG